MQHSKRGCGLSELRRTDAFILSENTVQMADIGEAKFMHDLIYTHIAVSETRLYQLQLVIGDVLLHAFASMFSKVPAEIAFRDIEMSADPFGL